MTTVLDPMEIYSRGLDDLSSLKGVERLVFMLQDFDNLMEMEGWVHFFLYEHHFAWYSEMKQWLSTIGEAESLAVLEDYEAHLRARGVHLSPDDIENFLYAQDDQYHRSCPDWCGQYCELRSRRREKAALYAASQGLKISL